MGQLKINKLLVILKDIDFKNLEQVHRIIGSGNYFVMDNYLVSSIKGYTECLLVNTYREPKDLRDIIEAICESGTEIFITFLGEYQAWSVRSTDFSDRMYDFINKNEINS